MIQLDTDSLGYASVLDNRYLIIDTIGQGRYAKVKLAIDIEDKQRYAVKVMKVQQGQSQQRVQSFVNEVSIQADLLHKNIVRITHCNLAGKYRKFDGRVSTVSYFVMKLADYGELYELIEQSTVFTEKLARAVYTQLIEGLEYMHERGVVHRDVKSENLLFSKSGVLKLADFGFSTKVFDDQGSRIIFSSDAYVGSPEYNPPELTNPGKSKHYSPESADLFASGVVLFTLVMKSAPFKSTKQNDEYYKIFKTNKQNYWKVFSDLYQPQASFRDFIEKMLDENAHKRLTIDQIKKHPWITGPHQSKQDYCKEVKTKFEPAFKVKKQLTMQRSNLKFQNRRQQAQSNKVIKRNNLEDLKPLNADNPEVLEAINAKLQVRTKLKKYDEEQKNKNDQQQSQPVLHKKLLSSMEEKKEAPIKQGKQRHSSSSGSQATPPDSDT